MAWDFENRRTYSGSSPVALLYDGFAIWNVSYGGVSVFSLNDASLDFYHDPNKFFDDYGYVPITNAVIGAPTATIWADATSYVVDNIVNSFLCIQDHTSSSTTRPTYPRGVDWKTAWVPLAGYNWEDGTSYVVGDFVSSGYVCIQNHVAGISTTPGSGAAWQTVWQLDTVKLISSATRWLDKTYCLTQRFAGEYNSTIQVYTLLDINRPTFIRTPARMLNAICAANGKLWMVSEAANADGRQTLHIYEIATDTWSSSLIPGRKQNAEPRDIIDGLDGSIYITDANSHGIHEYDHVTNAYVAFHRINRHPYKLAVNQAKTVYVTSDASGLYNGGMVSAFNQSTNTAASFCAAGGDHEVLCDDERAGYVWMFGRGAGMMRVNKTTKDVKMLNTGVLVWSQVPQDDLPNSGSTVAASAFQDGWTEGQSYASGTKCKSPIDDQVYVSSYAGSKAATQYDIPGVPDNAALSLWRTRDFVTGITPPTDTVDSYASYPVVRGTLIPRRSYEKWNGTSFDIVTIPEHIVVFAAGTLHIVRANALVRYNSTDVRGTALISVGPTDFIGDF